MIDEKAYVKEAFINNFSTYKGKKLVIYGLGQNTKMLLDVFCDHTFVGLMDGIRTGERVWDLPIITCEEAKKLGTDAIIILARSANVPIIYHRIAQDCEIYGIPVFDINGERLDQHESIHLNMAGLSCGKKDHLFKLIDRCQVISFDIFDTLLMRKVLIPSDIFEIVEQKLKQQGNGYPFSQERREAEIGLLNEGKQPKLEEIYERMAYHFPSLLVYKEEWMALEIETEKEYLCVRDSIKKALDYARRSGKRVFFTSDMYLSEKVLFGSLEYMGIQVGDGGSIISCQYGVSKNSGLYTVLRERFPDQKILHIGDDPEADGQCAIAAGIDEVFLVDSAYRMLGASTANRLMKYSVDLSARMLLGGFAAKQFCDPFIFEKTGKKVSIDSGYDLGYYFLAPLFTVFIQWLLKKTEQYKLTKLLLASRDGYIIKSLLDALHITYPEVKLPGYIYFYTSRTVCVRASVRDDADIIYAVEQIPFSGSIEGLLQKRFGVEKEELLERDIDSSNLDYVMRHRNVILKHAKEARCNYEVYLSKLGIKGEDRCGLFDFVSGGTCQYALSKFWDVKLQGLYFLRFYDPIKSGLSIDGLYQETNVYTGNSALEEKYIFLERIVTSFEPTLTGFDKTGEPLFEKETRSQEEIDSLRAVHKGILDAFLKYSPSNLDMADGFLQLLSKDHAICDLPFLRSTRMTDAFCNRDFDIPGF